MNYTESAYSLEYEYETSFYTYENDEIDIYTPLPEKKSAIVSGEDQNKFLEEAGLTGKVENISAPDPAYNCHLYAFGPKEQKGWIVEHEDVQRILDANYLPVQESQIIEELRILQEMQQEESPKKYRIVYLNSQDKITHSGIIENINSLDKLIIQSKLGKYGLFNHYPETLSARYGNYRYYRAKIGDGRLL